MGRDKKANTKTGGKDQKKRSFRPAGGEESIDTREKVRRMVSGERGLSVTSTEHTGNERPKPPQRGGGGTTKKENNHIFKKNMKDKTKKKHGKHHVGKCEDP